MASIVGTPSAVAVKDSLDPAIGFVLTLQTPRLEALLSIYAEVASGDGKLLGIAQEPGRGGLHREQQVHASLWWANQRSLETSERQVELLTSLSRRAIDHIETIRGKDTKGDVHLGLRVSLTVLRSRAYIRPTGSLRLQNDPTQEMTTTMKEPDRWSSNSCVDWVLSGDTSPAFLNVNSSTNHLSLRIPSTDWIHDFAPALGIGQFIVAELPVLDASNSSGPLAERVNRAGEAVKEMQAKLRDGEWDEVVEKARPVLELVRHGDFRQFLSEKVGYPQDALVEFWKGLDGLVQFSSKFLHPLTKAGDLRQPLTATKEDAYLIYSLSVGLANLIARKLAKAG